MLPAWPRPWWRWAGTPPDIELPRGVAEVEDTEWVQEPAYNRIFISGEAGGILGDYKRAGTAGDVLRPMVVHLGDSLLIIAREPICSLQKLTAKIGRASCRERV